MLLFESRALLPLSCLPPLPSDYLCNIISVVINRRVNSTYGDCYIRKSCQVATEYFDKLVETIMKHT